MTFSVNFQGRGIKWEGVYCSTLGHGSNINGLIALTGVEGSKSDFEFEIESVSFIVLLRLIWVILILEVKYYLKKK